MRVGEVAEAAAAKNRPAHVRRVGRAVLPPQIFDCLERTKPGAGNEIQLTDALRILAQEAGLWADIFDGGSYEAGGKLGFFKATVEIALQNAGVCGEFRQDPERL